MRKSFQLGTNSTVQRKQSFTTVLKEMAKDDKERSLTEWARPSIIIGEVEDQKKKPQINESARDSKESEILLFGVTENGHSILVRVTGFEHYLYIPAPKGISSADLNPLRDYLNALIAPPGTESLSSTNQLVSRIDMKQASTSMGVVPILINHLLRKELKSHTSYGSWLTKA
ncbi:DNA polymerase delta catalytic subunit [Psilocybe cubensis]|uniref:DNA polymerase delta catalytic subunit n=1 Tax=Psilocybe cubensis TaxID=181762 RepID=A0ACB8GHU1_PSICU|nr:DNA polymerase delta catalytic subunit [Psilocybe cubensis]KAH9475064.1 DNA polymerase delta catalytic subunit [Psilocybe cubensis]